MTPASTSARPAAANADAATKPSEAATNKPGRTRIHRSAATAAMPMHSAAMAPLLPFISTATAHAADRNPHDTLSLRSERGSPAMAAAATASTPAKMLESPNQPVISRCSSRRT